LLIVCAFVWFLTPRATTVVIQITSNTSWSGSIGGDAQSTSVDGSGSQSFQVRGSIIVAVVQKQTDYGFLTVSIIINGNTKVSQSTTAEYGVVSVSWSP